MIHPGMAIFVVFFGISLLEALVGGHWLRAAFWVGMGLVFLVLDRVRLSHTRRGEATHPDGVKRW